MRLVKAFGLVLLAAAFAVPPVGAHTPNGNGHSVVAGGLCEDGTSFDIRLVRGSGATAWWIGFTHALCENSKMEASTWPEKPGSCRDDQGSTFKIEIAGRPSA